MWTTMGGALAYAVLLGLVMDDATAMTFTMYSQPIELRYGEVYNRWQMSGNLSDHLLPEDVTARYADGKKDMAITGFTLDMVRKTADGRETQVKLSDHYLHHYGNFLGKSSELQELFDLAQEDKHINHMLTSCHSMTGEGLRMAKSRAPGKFHGVQYGSAAGAEYRHNPQKFQAPYALKVHKPEAWIPLLHIINTRREDNRTLSTLTECPCTPQRKIDPKAGTIDGQEPFPPWDCDSEFAKTGNPSCNISTYGGGWRCCEDKVFLIDTDKECRLPDCAEKPIDQVFMKFTFEYEDATDKTMATEQSSCCDTTGNNREHDVIACPTGTPPDQCVFVTENVQPLGYYAQFQEPYGSDLVDIVLMSPHLHWSGLSLELIDHETNETICEVHRTDDWSGGVMYGTGDEPGNEKGYMVGLRPCSWGGQQPKRYRRDHLFRSRSVYNATSRHFGVMSLFLGVVAAVPHNSLPHEVKDEVLV